MANINPLKKYLSHSFSSMSVAGDDFKDFASKLCRYIKATLTENGLEMKTFRTGHYDCSGYAMNKKNGRYVYWFISDVRIDTDKWWDRVTYRLTADECDTTGDHNQTCKLEELGKALAMLTERRGRYRINTKILSDRDLMKVGAELATLWGAECYGYEVHYIEQEVVFKCIEHGEHFITTQSFSEF